MPPADSKERHLQASPVPTGASRRSSTSAVTISKSLPSVTELAKKEADNDDLRPLLSPAQVAEEKELLQTVNELSQDAENISVSSERDVGGVSRSATPNLASVSKLSPLKEVSKLLVIMTMIIDGCYTNQNDVVSVDKPVLTLTPSEEADCSSLLFYIRDHPEIIVDMSMACDNVQVFSFRKYGGIFNLNV